LAFSSFFALLDDITVLLDDVAVLTKVAAKKTAGVLGDDLALNADQVAGVRVDRELPVVWAVAKGSLLNKAILVPVALVISAVAPVAITPLLMVGGAYLCFEGAEKVLHALWAEPHVAAEHKVELVKKLDDPEADPAAFEAAKIKGAVRTDFILSAEIVVISLGTLTGVPFVTQVAVLVAIALVMTVGVYGAVAAIVKLDDAGLALVRRDSDIAKMCGEALLRLAPWLMRGLSFAGTVAMFLVGGGIVVHGVAPVHHFVEAMAASAGPLSSVVPSLGGGLVGFVVGAVLVGLLSIVNRLRKGATAA
jgi:uncharacterized protein